MGEDHTMNVPNRAEILELIRAKVAVVGSQDVDTSEITSATLITDCVDDSLDVVEFVIEIEAVFDIEISDEEANKLTTIGDMVDIVERKVRL